MFPISLVVQRFPFQPGATDAMGEPQKAWGDPIDVGVWFFDPGGSIETGDANHNRVVTSPTLYGPPGIVFQADDNCLVGGELFLVDGHSRPWDFPESGVSGTVVKLKLVEG